MFASTLARSWATISCNVHTWQREFQPIPGKDLGGSVRDRRGIALKTKQDSGTKFGFVFQGANYEGGVCNALEYIWNYGGDVLDGDKAIVDSP